LAEQWYYSQEGQQHGPQTPSQIKELAAAGKLKPTDLIWKEGLESWIPASRLKGLFPETTPAENAPAAFAVNTGASTLAARGESDHPAAVAWKMLGVALGAYFSQMPAIVFVTVIWYVASLSALSLIITAPLAIAFTLGYVSIISQIMRREPFSLKEFVSFFNYGWNSLFYLIVLLACAFVILSLAVLAILAGMWFVGALTSVIKSPVVVITILAVFGLALYTLYFSFITLLFCLFGQVVTSAPNKDRPFDFIYDAFGNTMTILSKKWRTLASAGFWLALFILGVTALLFGATYGLTQMQYEITSFAMRNFMSQVITIIIGLGVMFLGTFSMVFFVSTANYLVAKTEPENGTGVTNA